MAPKIKSAWTGANVPGTDNRVKSNASGPTPGVPTTSAGATNLPARSGAGVGFRGPGEANVMPSPMSNVAMGMTPNAGSVMQQRMSGAGQAMQQAGGVTPKNAYMQAQTPQQAAPPRPAGIEYTVNGQPGVAAQGSPTMGRDGSAYAVGSAMKPAAQSQQATNETQAGWDQFSGVQTSPAEQAAMAEIAKPGPDQAFWQSQSAAAIQAIDAQSAAEMRALQQQAAAGGGGFGGVQLTQMGEVSARAMQAKAQALNEIAYKKATLELDHKKTILSVLTQLAGQDDQRTLALLNARLQQEAQNLDYGYTSMSIKTNWDAEELNPLAYGPSKGVDRAFGG